MKIKNGDKFNKIFKFLKREIIELNKFCCVRGMRDPILSQLNNIKMNGNHFFEIAYVF